MSVEGKTIQIFLPQGQPRGIRIAEITTRIVQAIAVPRTLLDIALARPEAAHVAFYFLFGQSDEKSKPSVYIGQTEDIPARMRKHNAEKEFWQTAVLLISRTHSFTQAHIKHLEWLSIQKAREASRFAVENGNEGSAPHVPEPMQADLEDIFSTASVLLGALGYPVFEPVAGAITIKAPGGPVVSGGEELFECTGPSAKATGRMVEDGFVVLKGSLARAQLVKSAKDSFVENKQQELLAEGILVQEGESLRFAEDYRFNTPSGAAMVVLGRHANGWTEWWLNGKSLDQLKRASDKKAGGR